MMYEQGFCRNCHAFGYITQGGHFLEEHRGLCKPCLSAVKVKPERKPVPETCEPDMDGKRERDLVNYGCCGKVAEMVKKEEWR